MSPETIWRIVSVLVGAAVPTGIGVYVIKRLVTGLGNRVTTAVDAYTGESAKLLARSHNIDKLIEQAEKLTAAAEKSRAAVATENALLDRKRDFYLRLLESLGIALSSTMEIKQYTNLIGEAKTMKGKSVDEYQAELTLRWRKAHTTHSDEFGTFMRLYNAAPLVLPKQALDILAQMGLDYGTKEADHAATTDKNIRVLRNGIDALTELAKRDLGLP